MLSSYYVVDYYLKAAPNKRQTVGPFGTAEQARFHERQIRNWGFTHSTCVRPVLAIDRPVKSRPEPRAAFNNGLRVVRGRVNRKPVATN